MDTKTTEHPYDLRQKGLLYDQVKRQRDELTLKDRNWQCNICGIKHDRDVNAAINIKVAGLKLTESGQGLPVVPVELPALAGTVKQECHI